MASLNRFIGRKSAEFTAKGAYSILTEEFREHFIDNANCGSLDVFLEYVMRRKITAFGSSQILFLSTGFESLPVDDETMTITLNFLRNNSKSNARSDWRMAARSVYEREKSWRETPQRTGSLMPGHEKD
uniref:Uncharacterized protein n=1 Tax=Pristionchus pacificus TaxID=54126 RepID=A0A2A6CQW1_PRIPA|eukprot:PDM80604.1 hypothetical protein PRIPAC_35607 [Pristionchus pacificus]